MANKKMPGRKTTGSGRRAGPAAKKAPRPVRARKASAPKKRPAPAARRGAARPDRPASPRSAGGASAAAKVALASITPEQQIVGAVFLGKVMNYFSHLGVVTLRLEAPLAVGDMVRIKGHTTDLTQKVDSLQVAHENVQNAATGEGVGLRVADKVRAGDAVYKV